MKYFYFMFFLFFNYSFVSAQERIASFVSDIVVNKNAALLVKETIEIVSEQKRIVHGIMRELSKKRISLNYFIDFNIKSVTCDGIEVSCNIESVASCKRIYIGDQNVLLPAGKHVYTITYETNKFVRSFEEYDGFYWNITGDGWKLPIDSVQVRIQFPADVPLDKIRAAGYVKSHGEQVDSYKCKNDGNFIMCNTTKPLKMCEGFAIGINIPKGFIVEPVEETYWEKFLSVLMLLLATIFCYGIVTFFSSGDGDSGGDGGGGDGGGGDGGGGDGW